VAFAEPIILVFAIQNHFLFFLGGRKPTFCPGDAVLF
jgi:hypothetical protein